MTRHRRTRLFCLAVFSFGLRAFAGPELTEIRQITTHPEREMHPAVSPDGRWLAFASDRSGNLDIWIKPYPRGPAVQVTTHQSEDTEPVWSPDGKSLVFVSKRRDPLGDLWRVGIDTRTGIRVKGDPVQLTSRLGMEKSPSFAPDGRRLVFVSDQDGRPNLYVLSFRSRKIERLTVNGGMDPAWSPCGDWIVFTRYDKGRGDLLLTRPDTPDPDSETVYPLTAGPAVDSEPAWSCQGDAVVFQRVDPDSVEAVLIRGRMNTSLWRKRVAQGRPVTDFAAGQEIQITTGLFLDQSPVWHPEGEILFSSDRGKGLDVWSIPEDGLFRRAENAFMQYSRVIDRFGAAVSREALMQSLLGYRRVHDYFPSDSLFAARALLRMGELYHVLGKPAQARDCFERVGSQYHRERREASRAALMLASLGDTHPETRIRVCQQVLEVYPDQPETLAETWILLGDLYLETGRIAESLNAYREVAVVTSRDNWLAQSQLRIGDLFDRTDQKETARQSYFALLRAYGDIPIWRQRAIDRLITQVTGTTRRTLIEYRRIIREAADFPSLAAQAQLAICDRLIEEGSYDRALRELEQVHLLAPAEPWAHARARILQARVFALMGDDLKGILRLEGIQREFEDLEGGVYAAEAREDLFALLFESAERLRLLRDYELAGARYRKALSLEPDNIDIHRGLIACMYYTGRIGVLIQEYASRLESDPDNPVLLYGMGLALSYQGERDVGILKQSNRYLEEALTGDYRLIYPYRALSFNYELMENLIARERLRERGFWENAKNRLVSPFIWLAGLLPFSKSEDEGGYYEKAIELLLTAIELNDETEDPAMEASLSQNLANNFYHLGEFGFRKALQYYAYRLTLDTTFSQPLEKAAFFERAGHCAALTGEHETAERYLIEAIDAYRRVGHTEATYDNEKMLAFQYQLSGRYEDAFPVYEKLAVEDERRGRILDAGRNYRNVAYNFYLLDEPEDAVTYAGKAEKILRIQKLPKGPPPKSFLRLEILGFSIPIWSMEEIGGASAEGFTLAEEAALVYGILSQSHEKLGDYDTALHYETERLNLFKNRRDRLAQRMALSRIGNLYYLKGEHQTAWETLEAARVQCLNRKDGVGHRFNVINLAQVALAASIETGDTSLIAPARVLVRKELALMEQDPIPDRSRQTSLLTLLGVLRMPLRRETCPAPDSIETSLADALKRLEDLEAARATFSEAFGLAREERDRLSQGILQKNMGRIAAEAGDEADALQYHADSFSQLERLGEAALLWRVKYGQARMIGQMTPQARQMRGIQADPADLYLESLADLEALPVRESETHPNLADQEDRVHLYLDAAYFFARHGNPEEALAILERGRQKRVADFLARRPPNLKRDRHKLSWGNLRFVRSRVFEVRRRLLDEQTHLNRRPVLAELKRELDNYQDEYRQILEDIRREDAVLAYLSGAHNVDVSAIQDRLTEETGAILYALHPEALLMFAVDRDTVLFRSAGIGQDAVSKLVSGFESAVEQDSLTRLFSEYLHGILIAPFAGFLQEKTRLLIVPDGPLWRVPFCALSDGREFLVDRMNLFHAPSLTAYRLAHTRKRINYQRGALIGGPADPSVPGRLSAPFDSTLSLFQDALSGSAIRASAHESDYILFRGHLTSERNNPHRSSITLYPGPERLLLADHFAWDLRASLIAYDDFGSGAPLSGRDIELWTLALLYAGTPSVILNDAGESPAPPGLASFFEAGSESDFAEALAETQIRLREARPSLNHWSGMKLIGFEGMDSDARMRFARANLVETVLKGRAYGQSGEFSDALGEYEKALDMAGAIGDTLSRSRLVSEIIATAMRGELWDSAIRYQKQQIAASRKESDTAGVMRGLNNLVVFYLRDGKPAQAAEIKRGLIRYYEQAGDDARRIKAYEDIGFIYAQAGDYVEAASWAQKAVDFGRSQADPAGEARALIRFGRFTLEAERFWKSREALERALSLIGAIGDADVLSPELRHEAASARQLLGLVFERMDLYEESLTAQNQAIEAFRSLNQTGQVALGYQYLANLYWKMGDYRQAMTHQRRALNTFQSADSRKELAMAYSTQGLIQMSLGDLTAALESQQRALGLAEQAGSPADRSAILKNMGLISIQAQRPGQAYEYFRRATAIDSMHNIPRGLAYDYRNLGQLLIQMNAISRGTDYLSRALDLSKRLSDIRNIVQSFYGLAEAALMTGNPGKAAQLCDSALVYANRIIAPEITWRVYRRRGRAHAGLKQAERAYSDYAEAVRIVEAMRAELRVDAFKEGFLDTKMDLYVDMIRHLLLTGRPRDAFDFVERAKSRTFLDMLANQRLVFSPADGTLLTREREARTRVQEAETRLMALQDVTDGDAAARDRRQQLEAALHEARQAYQSVLVDIQSANPQLTSFVSVDPMPLTEIQRLLPDSTALLEFFVSPDAVFMWMVTPTGVSVRVREISGDRLSTLIRTMREAIESNLSSDTESRELYQALIQPVENDLTRARHVVIVPHGILHYLPFAALQDAQRRVLLEKFSLSLAPSATVLGHCMRKGGDHRLADPAIPVLAISNPNQGHVRYDLPFAEREVIALRREYGRVTVFTGSEATEKAVRDRADGKRILHFACHATYEPDAPLFSALLLNAAGQFEDGRLEAQEIFGLNLDCDLVMLSACETGLAQITRGDEIIGLARSFIFAGAPSIVTSLWKVDDLATAVMVKRFYRYLRAGLSRAEALRQAQLLVRESVNDHPSAWAAFGLTGDFR